MRMWKCTGCGNELELCSDNFHKDKRIKRGFKSKCKSCTLSVQKDYRLTDEYKHAHAKAKRKWSKNDDHLRKMRIRRLTRKKYGSPPEGYEYHHEEPYHVDRWELVKKKEHYNIHN